jgi:hypothetical protein
MLRLLIKHKGSVELSDMMGCTPLHRAAAAGKPEAINVLLDSKARIDPRDKTGATPLFLAVQVGSQVGRPLLQPAVCVHECLCVWLRACGWVLAGGKYQCCALAVLCSALPPLLVSKSCQLSCTLHPDLGGSSEAVKEVGSMRHFLVYTQRWPSRNCP